MLVGISCLNHANRNAVCTENDVHCFSWWELLQAAFYLFDNSVQVGWMRVELFHQFCRNIFHRRGSNLPVPFVKTAAGGRFRVLRIEWQQDQFLLGFLLHCPNGLLSQGMPVPHGNENL